MKTLISDFDKTLFDNHYYVNIKKVNEFVDDGNMFIIATGRNITSLKKEISGKNIKFSYLICNDGGIIFDKDLNIIYRKDIDNESAIKIFDELNQNDFIANTYMDDCFVYTKDKTCKINRIIAKPIDIKKTNKLLNDINNKYDNVYGYASSNWLNINNKNINKGLAIKKLEELVNLGEIYTIGDNVNDISMNKLYTSFSIKGNKKLDDISTYNVNNFIEAINKLMND